MELILVVWLIRRALLGKWPFEMLGARKLPAPPSSKPNLTIIKGSKQ